jgi:anthranilate 1,2-dioxygenase ferredoxin component
VTRWVDAAATTAIIEGEPFAVAFDGIPVALFRLGDEFFALYDRCPHGQAQLSAGYVENGCVECPLHQGLIDIRSGAPRSAPITEPVRSFPIRVVGERIEIGL